MGQSKTGGLVDQSKIAGMVDQSRTAGADPIVIADWEGLHRIADWVDKVNESGHHNMDLVLTDDRVNEDDHQSRADWKICKGNLELGLTANGLVRVNDTWLGWKAGCVRWKLVGQSMLLIACWSLSVLQDSLFGQG